MEVSVRIVAGVLLGFTFLLILSSFPSSVSAADWRQPRKRPTAAPASVLSSGVDATSPSVPALSYLGCIHQRALDLRRLLIFPLRQEDLADLAGPPACAIRCQQINETYTVFLVHLPAKGAFTNRLVCGCGGEDALYYQSRHYSSQAVADSVCHLPCPQNANKTVDAKTLAASGQLDDGEVDQRWIPDRPGDDRDGPKQRLFGVSGGGISGSTTSKHRRRMPKGHQTCGDGHGFLSAYELAVSGSNPSAGEPYGWFRWDFILLQSFLGVLLAIFF